MKIELMTYPENKKIGKRLVLDNRDNLEQEFESIKHELDRLNIRLGRKVLCNFELGYKEEDIDCFIGYELLDNIDEADDLEIIGISKAEYRLVGETENNIKDLYDSMDRYSRENNIQIRDFYQEYYDDNKIEIIVEAYDLNEENEDYTYYLSRYTKDNTIDEELIGTYQIREILPGLKYMYNENKQKSDLNTKYKELELKEDGTTNYEDITWNSRELMLDYDNITIPLPIHKEDKGISILMNEDYKYYKSQRPMEYLYEKIK